MKRLLLFLETKRDYSANYEQIQNNFPNIIETDKVIEDTRDKNWIVKVSENKYKLTKTGEYEISKMTKKRKNEIVFDFKIVKLAHCTHCGIDFLTKSRRSWCSKCQSRIKN